ncbi:hypothetical protein B0H10DRAFT_2234781 [Mycena sp. CBHHK59/15]|nr:hypothetical protein B0H10DRAFT_2234781 [Mycena sp. CBHHK59/15]
MLESRVTVTGPRSTSYNSGGVHHCPPNHNSLSHSHSRHRGVPRALLRCTYRAGFEPIRDLPSLSALPPSSPSAASHNHNLNHNHTKHGHGHSPTQSDSSYSSAYSNSSVSITSSHGTRSSGGGSTASAGGTKKWWPLGSTKGWTSDAG